MAGADGLASTNDARVIADEEGGTNTVDVDIKGCCSDEEPESSIPSANEEPEMSAEPVDLVQGGETTGNGEQGSVTAVPTSFLGSVDIEIGPQADEEREALLQLSDTRGDNNNYYEDYDSENDHDQASNSGSRSCCSRFCYLCRCCCFGFCCGGSSNGSSSLCRRIKQSLFSAPTTPILASLLIPLLAIATHFLFIHGQTAPMWRLVYSAHVDAWANATSFEARSVFYTLGLDRDMHFHIHEDNTVREFTYSFAINELWVAAGMPGKLLPRIAAVLLIIFSGVWPHLKLILLSLTWFFATNPKRRIRILHWLSTFGKWSLADVLVVCVMIGVLHIDWNVDPTFIKAGIVEEIPLILQLVQNLYTPTQICAYLLHKNCDNPVNTFDWSKCASCRNFITTIIDHPETSKSTFASIANGVVESGDGFATLRVQGMNGIYSFCAAVVLSIVLSLVVDIYDAKARRRNANGSTGTYPNNRTTNENDSSLVEPLLSIELAENEVGRNNIHDSLLPSRNSRRQLEDHQTLAILQQRDAMNRAIASTMKVCQNLGAMVVSLVTSVLVGGAIFSNSLDRRVLGAGPKLLHDVFGIDWDRSFSIYTLALTTGEAGGYDSMLMGTFALFLVYGPAFRIALIAISLLTLPLTTTESKHRMNLLTTIDFLGAFCAWEVIALAAYLVSLLIPSTTATIVNRPECAIVDPDSKECLTIYFDPNDYFALLIVGTVMLMLNAQIPKLLFATVH